MECNERTIKRASQEGYPTRKILRHPELKANAQLRLQFTLELLQKSDFWFDHVVWSDESAVTRGEGECTLYIWRRDVRQLLTTAPLRLTAVKGEGLLPKSVQPQNKPTRHGQMFRVLSPATGVHVLRGPCSATRFSTRRRYYTSCTGLPSRESSDYTNLALSSYKIAPRYMRPKLSKTGCRSKFGKTGSNYELVGELMIRSFNNMSSSANSTI